MTLSLILSVTLLVHSGKHLSIPCLQHQLEMELSIASKIHHLALSQFIGLTSLYLGPLIKRFLKTLLLIVPRSLLTTCLWCLSAKGHFFRVYSELSGFAYKYIEV